MGLKGLSLKQNHFTTIIKGQVQVLTHHTLSMDAGVTGLTDVTGLGATTWPVTVADVALRTRADCEVRTLKT